jgi:hypothetical protein
MDWMKQLSIRMQEEDVVQVSIDGQIYTIEQEQNVVSFTNPFGQREQFSSPEQVIDAMQSWYENPVIVIL